MNCRYFHFFGTYESPISIKKNKNKDKIGADHRIFLEETHVQFQHASIATTTSFALLQNLQGRVYCHQSACMQDTVTQRTVLPVLQDVVNFDMSKLDFIFV